METVLRYLIIPIDEFTFGTHGVTNTNRKIEDGDVYTVGMNFVYWRTGRSGFFLKLLPYLFPLISDRAFL